MLGAVSWNLIGGAFTGFITLIVFYVGIMWAYIASRKKFSGAKYAVELFYIALAVLFGFGVKCAIFVANRPDTFNDGLAAFFYAIYSSIGGLEFEGLADAGEVGTALLQWLYSGSSVLAGLVFFSIILTKISYEMYSGILLFFLRMRLKTSVNTDIYLFTSVTQDSLLLANSINEKRLDDKNNYKKALKAYKKDKGNGKVAQKPEKARNSKVIFAGDDIGSFDRKNPLHREIMSNGYMFWSYSKKTGGNGPSMLKRLGLYIDNVFFEIESPKDKKKQNEQEKKDRENKKIVVKAKAKNSRIHVFAMHNDEAFSGEETVNAETVFDEIETVAREIVEYNKKPVFVDYYILTNTDINYTYYDNYKKKCIESALESAKTRTHRKNNGKDTVLVNDVIEVRNERGRVCESEFALHIINESDITSKLFVEARNNDWDANLLIQDTGESTYKVMVVGFGATGQRTMLQSYIMSTKIDNKQPDYHMPTQFRADVFDKDADSVCGIFELQHPLIVCVNDKDAKDNPDKLEQQIEKKRRERIDMTYHSIVGKTMNLSSDFKKDRAATIEDIENQMKLPVVVMHNASCFGSDYLDYLDSRTGADSRSQEYNLIIVALGKDEDNIKMANALLADIKHELNNLRNATRPAKLQTIAINILNKRNHDRINWSKEDNERYGNLKVIIFGSRDDIYSYRQIIDETECMEYHHAYYLLDTNKIPNQSKPMKSYYLNRETPSVGWGYFELLCGFYDAVRCEDKENLRLEWKDVPLVERESNRSALLFKNVMAAMKSFYCTSVYSYSELRLLVELEHDRWNRSYIANGWTYNQKMPKKQADESDEAFKKRRKKAKNDGKDRYEHDCLLPYSMLEEKYTDYDIANVACVFEEKQH